jgi:hypothetical protein
MGVLLRGAAAAHLQGCPLHLLLLLLLLLLLDQQQQLTHSCLGRQVWTGQLLLQHWQHASLLLCLTRAAALVARCNACQLDQALLLLLLLAVVVHCHGG